VRRREFITLLGGAAASWPLAVRAQQAGKLPTIGFLGTASPRPFAHLVAGFRRGLQETGFVEDRSVVIEYRWAEGHYDRVPGDPARFRTFQVYPKDLASRPVAR
jgi:putative tryptophan/tyrosine transport system substrate-binding protein